MENKSEQLDRPTSAFDIKREGIGIGEFFFILTIWDKLKSGIEKFRDLNKLLGFFKF